MVNFCISILILKMEKKEQIFSILFFIISRVIKTQWKCKKRFVQYMEKVLWLIKCIKSSLQSFISCWRFLAGSCTGDGVDQLKLIAIKLRHWEQSTLYLARDSQCTQYIQIKCWVFKNHLHQLGYVNHFDV